MKCPSQAASHLSSTVALILVIENWVSLTLVHSGAFQILVCLQTTEDVYEIPWTVGWVVVGEDKNADLDSLGLRRDLRFSTFPR